MVSQALSAHHPGLLRRLLALVTSSHILRTTFRPMASLPPALENPDILHQIFEELTHYQPCRTSSDYPRILSNFSRQAGETDIRSRTLASAALVCKTFSEPASRALWAVLYGGVEPLFRAFAAFKVVKTVDHSKDRMRGSSLARTHCSQIVRSISFHATKLMNEAHIDHSMAGVGRELSTHGG